ncbi:hypothetical protein [Sphingosinithalassobacter portus]|uniref:hypothetical protein n=1 Tax=Stakelama portus TaxID=2676234 RepID=UPI000D6E96C4|nr:hypothetical protein [Sphingosinithalassobacter portus]
MPQVWVNLVSALAWPIVGLIAVLILGPGGLLKGIIRELSSVTTSIEELKVQVRHLQDAEAQIRNSTQEVSNLREHLRGMEQQLSTIKSLAADLVTQSFSEPFRDTGDDNLVNPKDHLENSDKTATQLYDLIDRRWSDLCGALQNKLGDDFDARSIGDAAWRLVDGRRRNPLSEREAEHISSLFSTMKRFRRLQASKDDWLDAEVYENFVAGIEEALQALAK